MQHLNYCRQLVKQARNILSVPNQSANHGLWRHVIDLAAASTKFILPKGGRTVEDYQFRGLDELGELNLPFQFVALEYESRETPVEQGQSRSSKRIVFARTDDTHIIMTPVWFFDAGGLWVPGEPIGIPRTDWLRSREPDGRVEFNLYVQSEQTRKHISDWHDEACALMDFINALGCSNVHVEKSDAAKVRKAMGKKGALPFDDYHILTIDAPSAKPGDGTGHSGSHRSPREHLRRGHIRRYESGLKVWVNATVVNPGIGGKVSKDYRIKSATQGATA